MVKSYWRTCKMEDRLETEAKASDFHGVIDLDTVVQHSNSFPVFRGKHGVVVGVQSWTLVLSRVFCLVQPARAVR